jgi:hypothetical protein
VALFSSTLTTIRQKKLDEERDRLAKEQQLLCNETENQRIALRRAAERYAQEWNAKVAQCVMSRLPRELRDNVYINLFQLLPTKLFRRIGSHKACHTRHGDSSPHKLYDKPDYPHYFDPAYIRTAFVTELAEVYHSNASFYIKHQSDLARFLRYDAFGGMCIPGNHVRSLSVRLSLDASDPDTGARSCTCESCDPTYVYRSRSIYISEVAKLDILKENRLQEGSRLSIQVTSDALQTARKFEEALVPLVYSLRRNGWRVVVASSCRSVRRIRYEYKISEEDWKKKIAENSAFVSCPAPMISRRPC